MFKITKNQNLKLDDYLLLHISDFLHPIDLYILTLSCKIINNSLADKINNIKVIYDFNIYCYDILINIIITSDKYNDNNYKKKIYVIDSYFKTKFYYHTFFLSSFPSKEILKKVNDKLKQLNKKYKLKRKFKIRYWNTVSSNFHLNVLCFKKNFKLF